MRALHYNCPTNLCKVLFVARVDNINEFPDIDAQWWDLVRWSVDDTLSHNKAISRDYIEPLFNTTDGCTIRAYDAYTTLALMDHGHPIF